MRSAYVKSVSAISVFLSIEQDKTKNKGMNFVSHNNEYFCNSIGGHFLRTTTSRTKIPKLSSTFGITESKLNITTHYMVTGH